ncbi:MAG TPA: hypothetical protein VGM83_14210 [Devosiaceae bacterium]|jgi:hypothetical protein
MYQTDLEDLIDEYNLLHGLPPAKRNPPRPSPLPVAAKPKRPRRPRASRPVQIDLEELIAASEAAEASEAASVPSPTAVVETPAARHRPAPGSDLRPAPEDGQPEVEEDDDIRFLKEVAHIRERESQQPQYDYRFLMRPIQEMLAPGEGRGPAICACGHARGKTVNVHLIDRGNGTHRASATGIFRCGNGEACPACARHIAALRAKRYRLAHDAVTALGGTMVTFVFTIEHAPDDRLAPLLAALKSASTGARSDRFWNEQIRLAMQAVGAMTDTHVRWSGRGGWHPHLHVTLACLTQDIEALRAGSAMLIASFVARLAQLGHRASLEQQSVHILDARPNAYAAHHHRRAQVEGELAAAMTEDTSLSPFDIAELAVGGDLEMKARYVEFFQALRGTKSGVITAPMAKKLGIEACASPGPSFDETTRIGSIPSPVWMKLLDLNLTGTFLNHVETFGRAGWQRSRWWALQQTGFAPPVDLAMADDLMAAIKAIALLTNPTAKTIGQSFLASRVDGWTAQHGRDVAAATLSYAEEHAAFTSVGDAEAENMAVALETWADKATRRRRDRSSHMTLPMRDGALRAGTVPHGSAGEHVGGNGRDSHDLQTL